jgi:nitrogen fixation/metabolism regulation signal transduction histidine kinase
MSKLFKSKLFLKFLLSITALIVIYGATTIFYIIPSIELNNIKAQKRSALESVNSVEKFIEYIDKELRDNLIHSQEVLINRTSEFILSQKIGQSGYMFVFDKDKKMLIHPLYSGKSFAKVKNPDRDTYLLDEFITASKSTNEIIYKWNRLDDKKRYIHDKVAYIAYIEELGWYVCASAYLDDLKEDGRVIQDKILMISFGILILSLFVIYYLYIVLVAPIKRLAFVALEVKSGNVSIRSKIDRDDEIGSLSKDIDGMIDSLENQIVTLDKAVESRTQELEDLNQNLQNMVDEEVEKNRQKDKLLLKQSRQAAMGEMIGMIAHQWRQPITTIGMTADNMILDIELSTVDENKFKENLELVLNHTQYLSKTIDDFRNFFKPFNAKEKIKVEQAIDSSYEIIGKSLENNNIKFTKNIDSNRELLIYKNELIQVFLNIIKNSQDAYIERNIQNREITVHTHEDKDNIYIDISDHAGGIEKQIIEKIFEPYFSTKTQKQGTGIGLFMVQSIIQEHLHGTISVKNIDSGIMFSITLIKELVESD